MPVKILGWLITIVVVSACTTASDQTPVPTQTLIPATATATATPVIPTITPQDLPVPQDFVLMPTPVPLQPAIRANVTYDPKWVQLVQSDLATELDVEEDSIGFGRIVLQIYSDDIECPSGRGPTPEAGDRGYKITLYRGSQMFVYLVWGDDELVKCEEGTVSGNLLISVDPVAAELVALAQRRVSQSSNIPLNDVELVDVIPVHWQDSSIGCPQPDQVYVDTVIDGYRIHLNDGENDHVFHSDSVQIIACDIEDETS